ncbi:hypothetical protein ACTXT7_016884 [Hymenolepis weldensis]
MVKHEAVNYMSMFSEKKAMLLRYRQDHCFSGAMINKEIQCPVTGCLRPYTRQGWLKQHISESRYPLFHEQANYVWSIK